MPTDISTMEALTEKLVFAAMVIGYVGALVWALHKWWFK